MMKKIAVRSALSCVVFLATLCMGQSWQSGDVFVAVGNGYQVWRYNSTTKAYSVIDSFAAPLPAGAKSGFAGGCAFDSQFNFYGTSYYTDSNGNLAGQVQEFSNGNHTPVSTMSAPPGASSIVFDASGDFYVGSPKVTIATALVAAVAQYRPSPPSGTDTGPNPLPIYYNSATPISFSGTSAAQQLDLGTDQTSLFFTSANPNVKNNASLLTRVDLTNPSNNTINTSLPGTPWAVRLIAPGNINDPANGTPSAINGLIVADDSSVLKLNGSGTTALTFSIKSGKHSFRFVALDWDGQSVWVGDYASGNVYKVNISTMTAGSSFSTGSSNTSPMGGVCTFGGQQLNIVPLQFPQGTAVTRTAAFGDPQIDSTTMQPTVAINTNTGVVEPVSPNYHTWSATVNVVSPFTLVLSAIGQGPEPQASSTPTGPPNLGSPTWLLDRFDEWFCGQAEPGCNYQASTGPTLVPTPYADQYIGANNVPTVSGTGTAPGLQAGNRVVYRVQNPPDGSLFTGDIGITVHYKQPPACSSLVGTVIGPTGFTSASTANCYTPPQCVSGTYVSNPRLMRDPSEGMDPNGTDYGVNHQFALDTTSNFLLDTGVTSGGGRNDHLVADRCPHIDSTTGTGGFAQAVFNNPIPKTTVSAGSTVPIKITVTDSSGNPVTTAVTSPNNITIAVADQYGNLEEATAQSFGFFTQNGGAGGSYAANLNTTGLATGPTTICLTSVNEATGTGAGTSGQFPPICTTFTIQ